MDIYKGILKARNKPGKKRKRINSNTPKKGLLDISHQMISKKFTKELLIRIWHLLFDKLIDPQEFGTVVRVRKDEIM